MNPLKRVIFDNDIGIDDAMALLFLHYSPQVDLVAITTGFGNASLADTTRNALLIKQMFHIEAPVFAGADRPLGQPLGSAEGDDYPDFVHGKNGLGDASMTNIAISGRAQPLAAAQAMVNIVRENPGEISIVAVGRMTNLASALQLDPGIAPLIKEVVVMGGVFGYNGHRGNVSPVAEANIAGDPSAADRVATSGVKLSFIGLDVTEETRMDEPFINQIRRNSGRAGEFIYQITRHYFAFHSQVHGKPVCPVHDSSAVAYLLRPDLYQTRSAVVRVVTEGIAIGQTIAGNLDGDNSRYVTDSWNELDGSPLTESAFCIGVQAQQVLDLYAETLSLAAAH